MDDFIKKPFSQIFSIPSLYKVYGERTNMPISSQVVFRIYYNQKGKFATSIFGRNANLKIHTFPKKIYFQQKDEYDIGLFTKNIICIDDL